MLDDATLLRRYARERAEDAFAELVRRHVDLVYSAALRHVNGNVHRAEDVTQAVFIDLARKAATLVNRTSVAGWLYLSAHHAATQLKRTEQRREAREQEALLMNENAGSSNADVDWEKLQPVLDETIRQLNATDREAVLLRFFEQQPFSEIGAALKLNEDSARKRVERALEKLRAALSRHGITSSTAALGVALTNKAVSNAPASLAPQICLTTKSSVSATTGGFSSLKVLLLSHLNVGVIGLLTIVGVTFVGVEHFARGDVPTTAAVESHTTPAKAPKVQRPINPAWRAVIVVGLTVDEEQAARLRAQAEALSAAFQLRGIGLSAIKLVTPTAGVPVTRETVLEALRPGAPPIEETWIVLLGQVARNREGKPAFQVSGPRLAADDFAAAVARVPGKRFVITATTLSGGFLPALEAQPDTEAVAATAENGEINEPRFAAAWAEALSENPAATFTELASEAATRVRALYSKQGAAQAEHARIVDHAVKTIHDVTATEPKPESSAPAATK